MNILEILELIGIIVAIIFGIVSAIIAGKSNTKSVEANEIAKESNKLAERSLHISERLEKSTMENVRIKNFSNLIFLKNDDKKQYTVDPFYSDYIMLIPIEIMNISSSPVTIKRPTFSWGNDGEWFYVGDDDFIDVIYDGEKN